MNNTDYDDAPLKELRCNTLWCLVTVFRSLQDPTASAALGLPPSSIQIMLHSVEELFNRMGEVVASTCDEYECIRLATPMLSQGVLYLLTAAAIKEVPPTLPKYLASIIPNPETSAITSHQVLLRWLHNAFIMIVPDPSSLKDLSLRLAQTSPTLDIETHNSIIRSLCQHHCSTLVAMEAAQDHFEMLMGCGQTGPMYTVEDMVIGWIRGVLGCHEHYAALAGSLSDLYVDCSDGKVISMLLFAYYPDIMVEHSLAFQTNLTAEQRVQNWYAIITTLHQVGVGVTFTAHDVVYFGFQKLQLHFLSAMVELLAAVIQKTGKGDVPPLHTPGLLAEPIQQSLDSLSRSLENTAVMLPLPPVTPPPAEDPPVSTTANQTITSPLQAHRTTVEEEVVIASPSVGQEGPFGLCLVGMKAQLHTAPPPDPAGKEPSMANERTFISLEDPKEERQVGGRSPPPPRNAASAPPVELRRLNEEGVPPTASSTIGLGLRSSLLKSMTHSEDLQPLMKMGSRPTSTVTSLSGVKPPLVPPLLEDSKEVDTSIHQSPPMVELLQAFPEGTRSPSLRMMVDAMQEKPVAESTDSVSEEVTNLQVVEESPVKAVSTNPGLMCSGPLSKSLKTTSPAGKGGRKMIVQGSIDVDGIKRLMTVLVPQEGQKAPENISAEEALRRLQRENFALKAALLAAQNQNAHRTMRLPIPPQQVAPQQVPPPPDTSQASQPVSIRMVPEHLLPPPSQPPPATTPNPIPKPLQAIQRRDSQRKIDHVTAASGTATQQAVRTNVAIMRNAIRYVCLPGEVNKAQLNAAMSILEGIAESESSAYFMVLLKGDSLLFKALYYTLGTSVGNLKRCYGAGPLEVDIHSCTNVQTFKYNTSAKKFTPLAPHTPLSTMIAEGFVLIAQPRRLSQLV